MLNIIKKHPSLLYHQEIETICQPLKKLDITYFAHVKMTHEKNSQAFQATHYLLNIIFKINILFQTFTLLMKTK